MNTTTKRTPAVKAEVPLTTETTIAEMFDSLTGYDELAIERELERDLEELVKNSTLLGRAMVAIHRTREGDKSHDAWKFAMTLRIGQVTGYFAKGGTSTAVDTVTGEPDDEAGKDAS